MRLNNLTLLALLGNNSKISNSDNYINKERIGYSKKLINMNDELINEPDIIAIWLDTTDETYNGWTNYATWLIALWLDNDERLYHGIRDVKAAFDCLPGSLIHSWVICKATKICPGLKEDISSHNINLNDVNWDEIARSINDD